MNRFTAFLLVALLVLGGFAFYQYQVIRKQSDSKISTISYTSNPTKTASSTPNSPEEFNSESAPVQPQENTQSSVNVDNDPTSDETSNSEIDAAALASAKLDCANANANYAADSNSDGLGGSLTYQSFYNSQTSSCYMRSFATGHLPYDTNPIAIISFRDTYANTALAACYDKNSVSYADDEWTCLGPTDNSLTMAQFNLLVAAYEGN
jgi:hypothetical protein